MRCISDTLFRGKPIIRHIRANVGTVTEGEGAFFVSNRLPRKLYPLWKKTLTSLGEAKYVRTDISSVYVKGNFSDPTADHAEEKIFYSERIKMIEDAVKQTSPEIIANYLLRGVTEGVL